MDAVLDFEDGAESPPEWVVSLVCEAFRCVPSVAVAELERDPDLVFAVLDLRAYADAKRAVEASTSPENHPPMRHPMVRTVYQIKLEGTR